MLCPQHGTLRLDTALSRYQCHRGRMGKTESDPAEALRTCLASQRFRTILADPPWRFINRTGKMAPEHRRLARYGTMTVDENYCASDFGHRSACRASVSLGS